MGATMALLDRYMVVDYLPQTTVREAGNGEGVVIVRQKQLSLDMVGKWRPVEHFNAPGRDGKPK